MNAKRGYLPEDDRNFSPEAIRRLKTASGQICYLINEGYDLKQAATFVGNHFQLSERQRLSVMRTVATEKQLVDRKEKELSFDSIAGQEVWIDGFNTIITLEVMLCGSLLFEGMDGCIRDLASLRGTYRIIPETEGAVNLLLSALELYGVKKAHILLDEPVSNSGRLKTAIAEIAEKLQCQTEILIKRDVDRELYTKGNVITSDSIILDNCSTWVNLTAECVRKTGCQVLRVW